VRIYVAPSRKENSFVRLISPLSPNYYADLGLDFARGLAIIIIFSTVVELTIDSTRMYYGITRC